MFAWLDLREALPDEPTFADERRLLEPTHGPPLSPVCMLMSSTSPTNSRLFERMHGPSPQTDGGGILLTPGGDCFASEPGFFRACWAATPPEAHAEAAARIARAMR